ncbi:MAG: hypothetical protein F4128_09345 [Gammaproteobacteria bacterium]|nr:hypothetical protein [Gammaproteobacteria bacterium]
MAVADRKKPRKRRIKKPVTVDVWPHPLTAEGRRTVKARRGQTVGEILRDEAWGSRPVDAWIDGVPVPAELLPARKFRSGEIVTLRAGLRGGGGRNKILRQLLSIAVVAASIFVPGLPAFAGLGTFGSAALSAGVLAVGTLLVNALVPPELPRLDDPGADRATPVYSLSGGSNRARQYAPLLLVLGEHRVFPDAVTLEYTTFEDGEQFLHKIVDFGLGADLEIGDLYYGPNRLDGFEGVSIYRTEADIRRYIAGNVDTSTGANLENTNGITRAGTDALQVQVDLVGRIFKLDDEGRTIEHTVQVAVAWRAGSGAWNESIVALTSDSQTQLRKTVTLRTEVQRSGQYQGQNVTVRVRRLTDPVDKEADDVTKEQERTYDDVAFTAVKFFQPDNADYSGRNRVGIRFKASADLQGRIGPINAMCWQKVPVWNGSGWTAPQRTSNPAWITRWFCRGHFQGGRLRAGWGLATTRIDDQLLRSWGAWCDANSLACNYLIDREQDVDAILRIVAKCGRASPSWQTGKFGVVYDQANQTPIGMIHPGNIIDGSFGVEWVDAKVADEVALRYMEPAKDWQWNTIRRKVPDRNGNVDPNATPVETVTVTRHGLTDTDQAASDAGLLAAAHRFHKRRMDWEMSAEGLALRRGNVVWVNNSLIDGGEVGLLAGGTAAEVQLDREVTLPAGRNWILLRLADGAMHTSEVAAGSAADRLRLTTPLPAAPDAHGPAFDVLWRLYDSADPPKKAKIVAVERLTDREVRLVAIDEVAEYYDAATQSESVDGRDPTLPEILDISAVKRWVTAGNVRVLQVEVVLTVDAQWQGGQIRVGRGTAESVRVVKDLTADDLTATWVVEPRGEITITAIPRYQGSLYLPGAVSIDQFDLVEGLYDISPPTEFAATQQQNGVRRFSWVPPMEADLAGIVIRYMAIPDGQQGDFEPAWGTMTPAHQGVLTSSPWETEELPAGEHALAARALSTAGDLSDVVRATLTTTGILAIPNREFIYAVSPTPTMPANQLPDDDWPFDRPGTAGGLLWTDAAQSVTAEDKFLLQASREVPIGTAVGDEVDDPWLSPVVVGAFGQDGRDGIADDGVGIELIFAVTTSTSPPANPSNTWGFDTPGIAAYITEGKEAVFSRGGNTVAANSRPSNAWEEGTGGTAGGRNWTPTVPSGSGTLWKAERDPGGAGKVWGAPATLTLSGSLSSVWQDSAPTLATGQYLWLAQRRTRGLPQVGEAVRFPFTSPRGISRQARDGVDGVTTTVTRTVTVPLADGTVTTAKIALGATADLYTAFNSGGEDASRSASVTLPGGVGYQYIAICTASYYGSNQTVTLALDGRSDSIRQQSRFTHPTLSLTTSGSVGAGGKTITGTISSTSSNWGVNFVSLSVFLAKR